MEVEALHDVTRMVWGGIWRLLYCFVDYLGERNFFSHVVRRQAITGPKTHGAPHMTFYQPSLFKRMCLWKIFSYEILIQWGLFWEFEIFLSFDVLWFDKIDVKLLSWYELLRYIGFLYNTQLTIREPREKGSQSSFVLRCKSRSKC